jgi:hypothetical protein
LCHGAIAKTRTKQMHGHAPVVRKIMIGQSARERKATMQALAITKRSLPS